MLCFAVTLNSEEEGQSRGAGGEAGAEAIRSRYLHAHMLWRSFLLLLTFSFSFAGASAGPKHAVSGFAVFTAAAQFLRLSYAGERMNDLDTFLTQERAALVKTCQPLAFCPEALGQDALDRVIQRLGDLHTSLSRGVVVTTPSTPRWSGMRPVQASKDTLFVLHVDPGSPAQEAGVRPGDLLVRLGGRPAQLVTLQQLEATGTPWDVRVRRNTQELNLRIQPRDWERRGMIALRWVGSVAVVSVPTFRGDASAQFLAAVRQAQEGQATGLIVDLRLNGGGEARECPTAAEVLAPGRPEYVEVNRFGERVRSWRQSDAGRLAVVLASAPWTGPLALLTSERTASCAELLAYWGQVAGGTVVGTRTVGVLNSSTRWYTLPGPSTLSITVSRTTLENGRRLPAFVTPNIAVPFSFESGRDGALEEALKTWKRP